MREQIRNLLGAALLILAVGLPSCLALTGARSGSSDPAAQEHAP